MHLMDYENAALKDPFKIAAAEAATAKYWSSQKCDFEGTGTDTGRWVFDYETGFTSCEVVGGANEFNVRLIHE